MVVARPRREVSPRVPDGEGALRDRGTHQLRAPVAEGGPDRVSRPPLSARRRGDGGGHRSRRKEDHPHLQVGERGRPGLVRVGRRGLVHGHRSRSEPLALRRHSGRQAPRRDPRAWRIEAPRRRPQRARSPDARKPRVGIRGVLEGDDREREMSFLDYSFASDISPDARVLLFDEEGEAGGANYTVFLRKSDRSPVVRLGEGNALAISPDGKWALSMMPSPSSPFRLLPTGTGDAEGARGRGREPGAGGGVAARQPGHRVRRQRAGAQSAPVRPVDRRRQAAADHPGRHRRRHSGIRGLARRPVGRGGRTTTRRFR